MKFILPPIRALVLVHLATTLHAQSKSPDWVQQLLPAEAKVIETEELKTEKRRSRLLVLWMLKPEKVLLPDRLDRGCSEGIYGDHWMGPARLSLVDIANRKIINSISIQGSDFEVDRKEDLFHLPFWVSTDAYYVPNPDKFKEGVPHILRLRDYTGEGVQGQFPLFEYEVCGVALTSILGYSPKTDRVLQYRHEYHFESDPVRNGIWLTQTFRMKQRRPGLWDHTWDPGHGCDCTIHDRATFDSRRNLFVVHRTSTPYSSTPKKVRK